jgi:hypothetical protein
MLKIECKNLVHFSVFISLLLSLYIFPNCAPNSGNISWNNFSSMFYNIILQGAIFVWLTLHSLIHSWSWALLEKLSIVQLLKNIPAFYGTWRLITVFTRALHWSLSWARSIQSIPSHPISLRPILILSTHLHLHSGIPTNILCAFLFSPNCATCPAHLILLDLIILMVDIITLKWIFHTWEWPVNSTNPSHVSKVVLENISFSFNKRKALHKQNSYQKGNLKTSIYHSYW